MEATITTDCIAWPSHDNNDSIGFGNRDVEVITTHFKDICENSDVKIDDALTMGHDKVYVLWKAS